MLELFHRTSSKVRMPLWWVSEIGRAVVEPAPALAVDRLAQVHLVLLQGDGGGEDLHGGPGLVAVLHRVHPARGLLPVLVLAVLLLLRRGPFRFAAPNEFPGQDVVGVEGGGAGHGQDLAGVGIHHHRVGVGWMALLHAFRQGLLGEVLDGGVDGQLQGGPVHRDPGEVLLQDQQAALGVPGGDELPLLAGQLLVERLLDAQLAQAVDVGEAQDLARQAPRGTGACSRAGSPPRPA